MKTTKKTGRSGALLGVALLALGGCAAFSPPERPAWDGPDLVGDVDPGRLVGVWRVTPLNPYPDQGSQDTVIEYRADGTVVGRIDPGDDESMAAFGDAEFDLSGRWSVVDGSVVHEDMTMESTSDNPLGKMVSGMINGSRRDFGGRADIRELDADRMVMLGTDGAAMRYDRVR